MKKTAIMCVMVFLLALVAGWTEKVSAGNPTPTLDHFKCYRVVGGAFDGSPTPNVKDQFNEEVMTVGKPVLLCNPVDKIHNGIHSGINNDRDHLVCYRTISNPDPTLFVRVSNQFGIRNLVVLEAENLLCLPSLKNDGANH
jgi:hypothetical protein